MRDLNHAAGASNLRQDEDLITARKFDSLLFSILKPFVNNEQTMIRENDLKAMNFATSIANEGTNFISDLHPE